MSILIIIIIIITIVVVVVATPITLAMRNHLDHERSLQG
jgi:flagellar basal body-associated protein FliL